MFKIAVLGAGMVGSAIVLDLAKKHLVKVADINEETISKLQKTKNVTAQVIDLSNSENLKNFISDIDYVVNALPGFMGFNILKQIIENKKNVVDISFFPEDPFQLDELAKEKNVTAIMDCGVAPGMSNVILGYHSKRMKIENYECFVGGLPFERTMPYQYKAPFSPIDVLEEYTRPSRIVENGKIVIKEALSEPEDLEVENVGTLVAFNTDGLRTLINTMNIPNMKEKTLRYPGHIEQMKLLRDSGFLSKEEIDVNGKKVKPLDLTTKLLFPLWKLEEGESEFTYMLIGISGKENGVEKEYVYKLFDMYDDETKTSSMARTTGYACAAAIDLLVSNMFTKKGLITPEELGYDEDCFDKMMIYQEERKISYLMFED